MFGYKRIYPTDATTPPAGISDHNYFGFCNLNQHEKANKEPFHSLQNWPILFACLIHAFGKQTISENHPGYRQNIPRSWRITKTTRALKVCLLSNFLLNFTTHFHPTSPTSCIDFFLSPLSHTVRVRWDVIPISRQIMIV